MENYLDELAKKYGTDKQTNAPGKGKYHGYTTFYNKLFKDKREEYIAILEIGVQKGYSHRMWRDYFTNAIIYGIDFGVVLKENRIETVLGFQEDPNILKNSFENIEFDLIIDDGGHAGWQQQPSFRYLFPRLKKDRYYIIEDLETAKMRKFRQFDDERSSTIAWLNSMLTDEPFSYYVPKNELIEMKNQIETIFFHGQLGVVKKK